jgi:hypothetical protein
VQQETNRTVTASASATKRMSELLQGSCPVCFPGGLGLGHGRALVPVVG